MIISAYCCLVYSYTTTRKISRIRKNNAIVGDINRQHHHRTPGQIARASTTDRGGTGGTPGRIAAGQGQRPARRERVAAPVTESRKSKKSGESPKLPKSEKSKVARKSLLRVARKSKVEKVEKVEKVGEHQSRKVAPMFPKKLLKSRSRESR